ncbi:MAG: hypothetical protein L6Q78_03940 [Bacteroidia bacterium]|nr:hypothetical protein [Bacteroidia bacterium]
MSTLLAFLLSNHLKSRFVIGYTLILLLVSSALFIFTDNPQKGLLGGVNLVLLFVPLVVSLYTGISLYHGEDFTRVLLTQSLSRNQVYWSSTGSLQLSLQAALLVGLGIPLLLFAPGMPAVALLAGASILSLIFSGLSSLIAFRVNDKVKGIASLFLMWLAFTLVFDGLILLFIQLMSDYPIEAAVIFINLLNPVDMCRIVLMQVLDAAALMGLTGALLTEYMGNLFAILSVLLALLIWLIVPMELSRRSFLNKDF